MNGPEKRRIKNFFHSWASLTEDGNSKLTYMSPCHGTHFPLAWSHFPVLGTGAVTSSTGSRRISLAGSEPLSPSSHQAVRTCIFLLYLS